MSARRTGKAVAAPGGKMSGRAIQQAVLGQALQHPTTLYPFTAGAIAATYGIFVAPFLGGAPLALLVAGSAALISAGSFIWRYAVQGENSAREMARREIESAELRRKDEFQESIDAQRTELQAALEEVGWTDGQEALGELSTGHERLQSALERRDGLDPLARVRIERSANEAYREGLSALSSAAELARVMMDTDVKRLRAELNELESEIEALDDAERAGSAGDVKQQAIDLYRQRLNSQAQQRMDIERLLHQANLSCAALHRAHGTLGLLDGDVSMVSVEDVTADLDRTVEQAVRAQRSVGGSGDREADEQRMAER